MVEFYKFLAYFRLTTPRGLADWQIELQEKAIQSAEKQLLNALASQ